MAIIDANYLRRLAAEAKQKQVIAEQSAQNATRNPATAIATTISKPATIEESSAIATVAKVEWNEEQLQAIELARAGKEFCLIGAAGTGKTTTVKEIIRTKLESLATVGSNGAKVYPPENAIALVSFTNRAVRNIAKAVRDIGAVHHCKTIHKLLKFKPEKFIVIDPVTGNERTSMQFVPTHTAMNPITECKIVVCDESSMIDLNLFRMLKDACPNATFIFIGDLNQLPPVFGDAILGYKLAEVPVIELTRVYRQAMDSPIIAFQHNFTLKGKTPSDTDLKEINAASEAAGKGLYFRPLKKFVEEGELMAKIMASYLMAEMDSGQYDPESGNHAVLIPYNKQFGIVEINRHLAQHLGDRRKATVYEVISGIDKKYLAVGDLIAYNKREWRITDIKPNGKYFGRYPKEPSAALNRFGYYTDGKDHEIDVLSALDREFEQAEELLSSTSGFREADEEDVKNQASHIIEMVALDDDTNYCTAATSGEVNSMEFAYCTTIHKSQGSEWEKVYLIMTKHHAPMLSRELVYTGMTRAKRDLVVIYSPQSAPGKKDNSVAKGISRQAIPGIGWKSKVEFFKGKAKKNGEEI